MTQDISHERLTASISSLSAVEGHVTIALSGGVDSSATAWLLQEAGRDIDAVFMHNWEDPSDPQCPAAQDYADAQKVADHLGIELRYVNLSSEYRDRVFNDMIAELKAGRTPNPDVMCNLHIKFKALWDVVSHHGARWLATGHYASFMTASDRHLTHLPTAIDEPWQLARAFDMDKDQTYFLCNADPIGLAHTVFPLAQLTKSEARRLAKHVGLPTWDRKNSTGICFIGKRDFSEFVQAHIDESPGDIVTLDGDILGRHAGLHLFTIGQRKGLGIGGPGEAWYVVDKRVSDRSVVVAQGHDHSELRMNGLIIDDMRWISTHPVTDRVSVAIRSRSPVVPCQLSSLGDGRWEVRGDQPLHAATPGQYAAIYDGDACLGGGTITQRLPSFP